MTTMTYRLARPAAAVVSPRPERAARAEPEAKAEAQAPPGWGVWAAVAPVRAAAGAASTMRKAVRTWTFAAPFRFQSYAACNPRRAPAWLSSTLPGIVTLT